MYGILNFSVWEISIFHIISAKNLKSQPNNLILGIFIGFQQGNNFVEHCETIRLDPEKLWASEVDCSKRALSCGVEPAHLGKSKCLIFAISKAKKLIINVYNIINMSIGILFDDEILCIVHRKNIQINYSKPVLPHTIVLFGGNQFQTHITLRD